MSSIGLMESAKSITKQIKNIQIGQKFDRKLQEVDEHGNPTFPLAPKDLREAGLVTEQKYLRENDRYGDACDEHMTHQIQQYILEHEKRLKFSVIGPGLGRDLRGWVILANGLGIEGEISDASGTAIDRTQAKINGMLRGTGKEHMNRFYVREVNHLDQIDYRAIHVFVSGVIQIQMTMGKARTLTNLLGNYLATPGLERRITIVHAAPEHNEGVVWGDTLPISWPDIHRWLEAGAGGPVHVTDMTRVKYWHHVYWAKTYVAQI